MNLAFSTTLEGCEGVATRDGGLGVSVHRVWNYVPTFDLYDCVCGQRFPTGDDLDTHVDSERRVELVEL